MITDLGDMYSYFYQYCSHRVAMKVPYCFMTVRSKYDQDLNPDAVDTVFFGGPLNSHCPFVVAVT